MKNFTLIFFIVLIVYIYTDDNNYCYKEDPSKASECHKRNITGLKDDFEGGDNDDAKYCCYFKYTSKKEGDGTICLPMGENNYKNIKDLIEK